MIIWNLNSLNFRTLYLDSWKVTTSIQSEVKGGYLFEPGEVAEAFATLLNSVYDDFSPGVFVPKLHV